MATLQNIGKLKYRGKDGQWHPLPVVVQDASGGVSTISGKGAPTSATQGKVNQLYRDEDTQRLYICTSTDGGYTWTAVVSDTEDAVTYTAQTLTEEQKTQARANICAGTSNFSGSYNDLSNKPNIPVATVIDATLTKSGQAADAKAAGDAIGTLYGKIADDRINLEKYNITVADYDAPFTAEMYEVAYANGIGIQAAINDAIAAGKTRVILPPGNYPLCYHAAADNEINPIIDARGINLYGYGVKLYIIYDEEGTNPYFTGDNPYLLSGHIIETENDVYLSHIVGERRYRKHVDTSHRDDSAAIALMPYTKGNTISVELIEYISGDGIVCGKLMEQQAKWESDTFNSVEYDTSSGVWVESNYKFRSTRHGADWIDKSKPLLLRSEPNYLYSTGPLEIICFDENESYIGKIETYQGEWFKFFEDTYYWYLSIPREVYHEANVTESWTYAIGYGTYCDTTFKNCEIRFCQRGGTSNAPNNSVFENCLVHHNGGSYGGVEYYDSTRFGHDQEEVVVRKLTFRNCVYWGSVFSVLYKCWAVEFDNCTFFDYVKSLNGCVDFFAKQTRFVKNCTMSDASTHGSKIAVGCTFGGEIASEIVIMKPSYDYTLPEASSSELGGVKADDALATDTQPVRKGTDGKLYTAPGGGSSAESGGTWVKIADYTWTDDDAAATSPPRLIYTTDVDGNALSIDAIYIICNAKTDKARTLYGKFSNDGNINYTIKAENMFVNNQLLIVYNELKKFPVPHAVGYAANGLVGANGGATAKYYLKHFDNEALFVYPATAITIFPDNQILAGSTFSIWGRVAT